MTEQEQKDLVVLRDELQKTRLRGFDYLVHLSSLDEKSLQMTGHTRGLGQAMINTVKSFQKDCKKLTDAHTKRYPD